MAEPLNLLSRYYHDVFEYSDRAIIKDLLKQTGGPLLDMGCATGRVLEIASQCGITSFGIDNSMDMIEVGRQRLKNIPGANFIHADFHEAQPHLVGKIGLATILANTYTMTLDKNARVRLLSVAREYLAEGGRIFVYVRSNSVSAQKERRSSITLKTNQTLDFHIRWEEEMINMLRRFNLTFSLGEQVQAYEFSTAIVPLDILIAEFASSGLEIETKFGDFDRSPINSTSAHWFFILQSKSK